MLITNHIASKSIIAEKITKNLYAEKPNQYKSNLILNGCSTGFASGPKVINANCCIMYKIPIVAIIVASGSYFKCLKINQSLKTAVIPTIMGTTNKANKKPIAGLPETKLDTHHVIIAPSMKNSPWATFTILITPNTRLNPKAISDKTAACTKPSKEAKSK